MKNIYKKHFPAFKNLKMVYLDNGATTQICAPSIDALKEYYLKYRSNVHRGMYEIAEKATAKFEEARTEVAKFLNAEREEIIFTSGTTHGLNFICSALTPRLGPRDNVVISKLEHHSNLVPWQQAARHYGFELRFLDLTSDYQIDLESAKKLIDKNTKILSFSLVSNVLGTIAPAAELIKLAKAVKSFTVIDAAQAVAHTQIDVKKLDCDFLAFSAHKMYGPNGSGAVYGKKHLLEEALEPVSFGGEMVSEVTTLGSLWAPLPYKFEAGTPSVADVIGLGAACKFISKIGWKNITTHENDLTDYALKKLTGLVKIFGPSTRVNRVGVISFNLPGLHPHDLADLIGRRKVAVRAGAHCAEPLHRSYKLPGTVRASLGIYNTKKDIDALVVAINYAQKIFKL